MTLNHLSHAQVAQIVAGMTEGKTFPAEVLQQIIAKTDGVPLFVEEMTKAILESGGLKETDGHYELVGALSTFTIPATLQDSLMARLDRLVTAKGIAQLAAVIGRQFPYDLLQAVSQFDEVMLQHELGRLVEAEIVYQRGVPPQATYTFKHALIQDAAYLDNVTLGCIIGFHLTPQTATGRTSPIDQMCDHQLGCLLGRQLRYGQHRLQQLSHVGRRERR